MRWLGLPPSLPSQVCKLSVPPACPGHVVVALFPRRVSKCAMTRYEKAEFPGLGDPFPVRSCDSFPFVVD